MSGLRIFPSLLLILIAERSVAFVSRPAQASSLIAVRGGFGLFGVPFFVDDVDDVSVSEVGAGPTELETAPPADVVLSTVSGDSASLREAAEFMADSFWLQSPQDLVVNDDDPTGISDGALSSLIAKQEDDLTRKYGEIMGARRLRSCLIAAADGEGRLGLVGVETVLLDRDTGGLLAAERSEAMLKNAVASLGPKQRRQYKDSTASELVETLLPENLDLIVVLSNLSVSPRARRRGVAASLCREVERIAKEDWAFDEICLQVEKGNVAARGLYEGKLGYETAASKSAVGLRVDVKKGTFEEVPTETLLLTKKL